jgi:hypothetical protein
MNQDTAVKSSLRGTKITERLSSRIPLKTTAKMNNLNAHATSDRCKIASSAEKAFSQWRSY